jgi:hypothetical protein
MDGGLGDESLIVDMTAIGVVATSLNTLVNITRAMKDVQDATLIQGKVFELQRAIIDAQQSVFAANEERTVLIERVRELEAKIAELETWETERQRYELKDVGTGSLVYAVKECMRGIEPIHNICANCYQKGHKSILQPRERGTGKYLFCQECNQEIMFQRAQFSFGKKSNYPY